MVQLVILKAEICCAVVVIKVIVIMAIVWVNSIVTTCLESRVYS